CKAQRADGRPIDREEALQALGIFFELPIIYHTPDKPALLETLRFADQAGSSFQDASYLQLALLLNCRLLTADRAFVSRVPEDLTEDHILMLQTPA
ncbi:MAG: hypothetical protein V2B18_01425, partial [Pseudomonadota bacterium]